MEIYPPPLTKFEHQKHSPIFQPVIKSVFFDYLLTFRFEALRKSWSQFLLKIFIKYNNKKWNLVKKVFILKIIPKNYRFRKYFLNVLLLLDFFENLVMFQGLDCGANLNIKKNYFFMGRINVSLGRDDPTCLFLEGRVDNLAHPPQLRLTRHSNALKISEILDLGGRIDFEGGGITIGVLIPDVISCARSHGTPQV